MVSYARSTYQKAEEFNKKLKDLENSDVSLIDIRTYMALGEKAAQDEDIELNINLDDETKAKIDELKRIRKSGIQGEMRYILAQAKANGVSIPEDIQSGDDIRPGFSSEVLKLVPSLGVYSLFMVFTEKELDTYLEKVSKSDNTNEEHSDNTQSETPSTSFDNR